MELMIALSGILFAVLVGAISPGPSFVLVSRTAISCSRRNGLYSALGMGLGGAIFALLAIAGLMAFLIAVPWVYALLKVAGGLYLLYIAVKIFRNAWEPLELVSHVDGHIESCAKSLWMGLATQLSNPKTAVVYGGIFAALLPEAPSPWITLLLPFLIFLVESAWYAAVALIFSSRVPRASFLRSKTWIDRATAVVLGAIGGRLIAEEISTQASFEAGF